jgi:hypothetical protein
MLGSKCFSGNGIGPLIVKCMPVGNDYAAAHFCRFSLKTRFEGIKI